MSKTGIFNIINDWIISLFFKNMLSKLTLKVQTLKKIKNVKIIIKFYFNPTTKYFN